MRTVEESVDETLIIQIDWVRWPAVWVTRNLLGDDLLARLVASSRYKDVREYKEWEAHKDAYVREFYGKVGPSLRVISSANISHRFGRPTDSTGSSLRLNPCLQFPTGKSSRIAFSAFGC